MARRPHIEPIVGTVDDVELAHAFARLHDWLRARYGERRMPSAWTDEERDTYKRLSAECRAEQVRACT